MAGATHLKLAIGNQVCLRLEGLHPRGRMEIPHGDVILIKKDGIYINIPIIDSKYLEGRKVEILWEKGMCLYCLSSTINKCIQEQETTVVISPSDQIRSIDKRHYFRLESPIHIEFKPTGYRGLFIAAEGKDISGGGIRFITKYPLKQGEQLEMLLEVPIFPYLDVSALGQVVRVEKLKKTDGSQIGVHFMDMEPMGRKRLLKYIIDEKQPLKEKKEDKEKDLKLWFCLN